MTRHNLALIPLLTAALFPACGKEDSRPPMPAFGPQIDRMGRAGINTAVTDPFFPGPGVGVATDPATVAHFAFQDAYNADSDPSQWAARYAPRIARSLAIIDSLDAVCGNQLLAGPSPAAGRYNALAGVLADDRLYVDTRSGTCQLYLGVEANAAGVANADCGGRTPLEDTIDVSLSVLAAGLLSGVSDGIDRDADANHSTSSFPFLGAPVPVP